MYISAGSNKEHLYDVFGNRRRNVVLHRMAIDQQLPTHGGYLYFRAWNKELVPNLLVNLLNVDCIIRPDPPLVVRQSSLRICDLPRTMMSLCFTSSVKSEQQV